MVASALKVAIIGNFSFAWLWAITLFRLPQSRSATFVFPGMQLLPRLARINYFNKLGTSKTIRNNRVMPDGTFHSLLISPEVCDV